MEHGLIIFIILVVCTTVACTLIFYKDKNGEYKFFNKDKEKPSEDSEDMYAVRKYIHTYRTLDDAIHKKNPTDHMLTPGYRFKILTDWGGHRSHPKCYKIIVSCNRETGVALIRWINDSENQVGILKELIDD